MPRALRLLCAVPLAALALSAPVAHADQYTVDHCRHFDADTPFVAFGLVSGSNVNDCNGGSGGLHADAGGSAAPTGAIQPGAELNIVLSIPADRPNIQIERVQTVYGAPAQLLTGVPTTTLFDQPSTIIKRDATGRALVTADALLPPGSRALRWDLSCDATAVCQWQDPYPLFVNRTRLYLNESVNPTLVVTANSLAGGPKAGQQSLTFDDHDTDSGVSAVTVALDATVVGAVQYPCAFADWSVCPRDHVDQALAVDTTKVPDGDHALSITVRDAANNTLTRALGTVAVANGAGVIGTPNGTNASRAAKLTVRFTTTKARSRHLGYRSRPTVKGTLVDEHAQPIGGASIAITQRPRQSRAVAVQIAGVQTAADGTFSARLAGGPSRTLTFAYTAFNGDAAPAASARLTSLVRALVSGRVTPRSTRPGRRIRLAGRLRLLPRSGVDVRIQARDGKTWRTVDVVRTTRGGRFQWPYRFKASAAGRTFVFRARVASPIYPFAPGNSGAISVRVR